MEERTSVVEEGDVVKGLHSTSWTISDVQKGRCGLLVQGVAIIGGRPGWAFLPYEMVLENTRRIDYRGWHHWEPLTVNEKFSIMSVNFHRSKGVRPISEYDDYWEEAARDSEPQPMQSRPTDIRLN